jgi:UDP-N-acetylmuramyl pentapeptide synthase
LAVIERLKKFQRSLKAQARLHIVPYINDFRHGRIPVVMVTGSVGKTTTSRLVAAILKEQGHRVGLACTASMSTARWSVRATSPAIEAHAGFSLVTT